MDPADLEHVLALYDGEIAFTDHHLGRLLNWLKGRDLVDKTIVVVTSDHGEEFFEHGERGHRNNLYDETLLVPLLFRYPEALPGGVTVSAPVRLQDVASTILELAGLGPVPGFGSRLGDDPLSGHSLLPLDQPRLRSASGDLVGRWSFLRQPDAKVILTEGGSTRLYDLREDPGEQEDVASEQAERTRALEGQLRLYRERARARRGTTTAAPAMDEGRQEMLRGLGYVD
jgi:arylsulfatase A-like enzyme